MRYTENELRNCLEGRLKWYQQALEYRRKGTMPPIGFPLPDGDINTWEGAARELKNTLNMIIQEERLTDYVESIIYGLRR